jgi:hypothetical protein
LIYQAVGRALSSWEQADQQLAMLFMVLTGCDDPVVSTAIRRAYGSIESNVGRRKAVRAVAEIHFRKYWEVKSVSNSIDHMLEAIAFASRRRDDIAHGIVIDGIVVNGDNHGAFLMPPEYNTGRTDAFWTDRDDPLGFMHAQYRYVANDVTVLAAKFNKLEEAIRDYMLGCIAVDGKIPVVEYLLQYEEKDGKKA